MLLQQQIMNNICGSILCWYIHTDVYSGTEVLQFDCIHSAMQINPLDQWKLGYPHAETTPTWWAEKWRWEPFTVYSCLQLWKNRWWTL